MLRQAGHCLFTILGFAFGAVMFTAGTVGFCLLYVSYLIHPESRWGNCWSYAVPRWLKFGGYLALRPAPDVKFLKIFPVIHVLWCKEAPRPGSMRMTRPKERIESYWLPYETIYFPFKISRMDTPHNADPD